MNFSLRVEGGEQLARSLRELSKGVERHVVKAALLEAAEPVRDRGAQNAPRDPGAPDIAANIVISGRARGAESGDVGVAVGPSTELRSDQRRRFGTQGKYVELGTARQAPQPFMRPALESTAGQAIATMSRLLWHALASRGVSTRTSPQSGLL